MDNDFLDKLTQQGRGQFFKVGVAADNVHKLFRIDACLLRFGEFPLQLCDTLFELALLGFIVCRQFHKAVV